MDSNQTTQSVIDTIQKAIAEANELLPDQKIDNSAEAVWLGPESNLDSLSLTYFIVALDKNFQESMGIDDLGLGDFGSSLEESPLGSMANLIRHIESKLKT